MKKVFVLMAISLIIPFIIPCEEAKEENKITFAEFKEMAKDMPYSKILIKNMEKFGLQDNDEGFIIKFIAGMITQGNGYAYPTTFRFSFFSLLPVIWYYTDGSTEFYTFMGKEVYGGSQIGAALIYPIGMWIAPRLFQQPGNIFGIGIVAIAVIYPVT